jgi:hypothetical protein
MPVRDRRWPIDDLIVSILAKRRYTRPVELTDAEIAQDCNVTIRAVQRWRQKGLTAMTADRAACAIGLHPYNVWPSMADTDLTDTEEVYQRKLALNRDMKARAHREKTALAVA